MQRLDTDALRSKEQSTQKSDLTGNYTTAFNLGKQDEVHHRKKNAQ